jgi:hypothetical protein
MIPEKDEYNISELAKIYGFDRATVSKKLDDAGIKPHKGKVGNEKLYFLSEVEPVLAQENLEEARLRKMRADAELSEIKALEKKGDFASVAEFTELTHQWVNVLFTKFDKKFPENVTAKVAKAKNKAEAIAVVRREVQAIFNEFRSNPKKFLNAK